DRSRIQPQQLQAALDTSTWLAPTRLREHPGARLSDDSSARCARQAFYPFKLPTSASHDLTISDICCRVLSGTSGRKVLKLSLSAYGPSRTWRAICRKLAPLGAGSAPGDRSAFSHYTRIARLGR